MSQDANGAGPKKKLLEVLFPTTQLLGALTIANQTTVKSGSHLLRGIVTRREEALPFCNMMLESMIQGVLSVQAGPFKQFHSDKPVVICSQERAESEYAKRSDIKLLISAIPLRSAEYPREFKDTTWIEPMCSTPDNVLYTNPEWEAGRFEIELHCDPDKIFYDYTPIELFRGKNSFLFYISGDVTVVEEAVEAVVVPRNVIDKTAAVSSLETP